MVRRCGCEAYCSCTFEGSEFVSVSPNGDDVTVTIIPGSTHITVEDSESLDFTITGSGTPADPYVITADKVPGAPDPAVAFDQQKFTTDGIWVKPTGFGDGWVEVFVWGGGGGGAGANIKPSIRPGNGGGGGGLSRRIMLLSDLPDEVEVHIGFGGAGGTGAPDSGSHGTNGHTGGQTRFGTILYAGGGFGGTRDGTLLSDAPDGGYGTEPGGRGGLPLYDYSFRGWDDSGYMSVGQASSGGGAGGYPSTKGPAQANSSWWDGVNGGLVIAGGFFLPGFGGNWQTESGPTTGAFNVGTATIGSTGGGGGHGGGAGPGNNNRSRTPGAAGGNEGGGGGGGGGAGPVSGGDGGPGGSGKIIVNCWPGTT